MERTNGRGRKIPEVLTEEEQKALLAIPNKRYPSGQRNKVLLRLMLDTGLRRAEVINLKWVDVDLMTGKLMVRNGKGAKDRSLWIGDGLLDELREWKERQAGIVRGAEYVFTSISKGKEGNSLGAQYVYDLIKRLAGKAGITKEISPHTLRHTFATDLYRETKNIRLVQKALGHSDLGSTMIYTHIVDDELEDALKGFRGKSLNEKGIKE